MALLCEKEQEIEACEQRRLALDEAIEDAVTKFPLEEGQEDAYAAAKVAWLSRIAIDIRKQFEELKEQHIPSTPPEVIEEHRKTTSKVSSIINEGENLCTKAIAQFRTLGNCSWRMRQWQILLRKCVRMS